MKNNPVSTEILLQKYNTGALSPEEELLLEQYLEQGLIELEQLQDLQQLDQALDQLIDQQLTVSMRRQFQEMLAMEKQRLPQRTTWNWLAPVFRFWEQQNWVSALAFVVAGIALTLWWYRPQANQQNLQSLSEELREMRELMALSLLEAPSSTKRLQAVEITQEMHQVSEQVTNALFYTLNNDDNVNVRLATLDMLYQYADNPKVRQNLVESIGKQDNPMVLMALAEIMVSIQEKNSVRALQKALENENTPEEVRQKLRHSIQILM